MSINEKEKAFVGKMQSIQGIGNIRGLWDDWVTMLAIALSQVHDPRPEREQMYKGLWAKYTPDQANAIMELTGMYFDIVDDSPYQDLLGNLYMQLNMGNSSTGQFFTPYHLSQLLSQMIDKDVLINDIQEKGWCSCNDPACGGGSLLIAAAERMLDFGINYQQKCIFIGQELGFTTACSAYIQMCMLGMPGAIICGDTLRQPCEQNLPFIEPDERTWITPAYFSDEWKTIRIKTALERAMKVGRQRRSV